PRLGFIKTLRPMLPIHFHVPLHGDYRHAERLHNFFRPHGPSHDHLTREHPEAPYICLLVLKHRQVSVHITNLAVLGFYRDPIVNLGHSGWKDWQLQLWHASSYQPFATAATIFWLILISSTPRKSPVRSGCLTLYQRFVNEIETLGVPVATGVFQAMMNVELTN